MNREIKFRAWYKILERIIYDDELEFSSSIYKLAEALKDVSDGRILMQFTGLLDKNGKEIYEGDIIQWGYGECKECGQEHKKRSGEVYWNDFSACYQTSNGDYLISNRGNTQLKGNGERDDLEIIGNIYENPELISNMKDNKTDV